MDLKKLKLARFRNIVAINFPKEFNPGFRAATRDVEVVLYYIDSLDDVKKFVKLCTSTKLPEENRIIMVYRKGRTDGVNRDTIFKPFRKDKRFTLKAPMLCSLSDELSACVMAKVE